MKQLDARGLLALRDAVPASSEPLLLLDVREPWEVAIGTIRIDGAETRTIPLGSVPSHLAELDPAQPVVCFCHHGMRSAQVVAWLDRQGFDAVYNLAGGTDAWSVEIDPGLPRY